MTNAFVRKITAYGQLSEEETRLLIDVSDHPRAVPAHRDLIREGDRPGPLIIILEGWACRYKMLPDGSRQITAFLLPGDFCDLHAGELEAMDHSIGTLTPCRVKVAPRDDIEALLLKTPALTRAFWRAQLIDEGILRAWIVSIGRRNSTERIAHLMLELYVRMRNIGLTDDGSCDVPLTQTVLADAIGLTPVHVNRVLRTLLHEGIMQLGSKKLTILDIGKLATVAGFDANYLHRRIPKAA